MSPSPQDGAWRVFCAYCSPGGRMTEEQLSRLVKGVGLQGIIEGTALQAAFADHASAESAADAPVVNFQAFLQLMQEVAASKPDIWEKIAAHVPDATPCPGLPRSSSGRADTALAARLQALEELVVKSLSAPQSNTIAATTAPAAGTAAAASVSGAGQQPASLTAIASSLAALATGLQEVKARQAQQTELLQLLSSRMMALEGHAGQARGDAAGPGAAPAAARRSSAASLASVASGDAVELGQLSGRLAALSADEAKLKTDVHETLAFVCVNLKEIQKTTTQTATMVQLHEGAMHVIHERLAALQGMGPQVDELQARVRHVAEELDQHMKLMHGMPASRQVQVMSGPAQGPGGQGPVLLQSNTSLTKPLTTRTSASAFTQGVLQLACQQAGPMGQQGCLDGPVPSVAELQQRVRNKRSSQPGETLNLDSPAIRTIQKPATLQPQTSLRGRQMGDASPAAGSMPVPPPAARLTPADRFRAIQDAAMSNSASSVKSDPGADAHMTLHAAELLSRGAKGQPHPPAYAHGPSSADDAGDGAADGAGRLSAPRRTSSRQLLGVAPAPAHGVLSTNATLPSTPGSMDSVCLSPEMCGSGGALAAAAEQLRSGKPCPPRPPRMTTLRPNPDRSSTPNLAMPFSPTSLMSPTSQG